MHAEKASESGSNLSNFAWRNSAGMSKQGTELLAIGVLQEMDLAWSSWRIASHGDDVEKMGWNWDMKSIKWWDTQGWENVIILIEISWDIMLSLEIVDDTIWNSDDGLMSWNGTKPGFWPSKIWVVQVCGASTVTSFTELPRNGKFTSKVVWENQTWLFFDTSHKCLATYHYNDASK